MNNDFNNTKLELPLLKDIIPLLSHTDTTKTDESEEMVLLKSQILDLKWQLSDVLYDANKVSRMYLSLCDKVGPSMDEIQSGASKKLSFSCDEFEAKMKRPPFSSEPRVRDGQPQSFSGKETPFHSIMPAPSSAGVSVAVQLHLYYTDLMSEFISFFENIPFLFDLYISCREDADKLQICKAFSTLENAQEIVVRNGKNRGRDIAPVYVLFRDELARHDIFLHVHSKKSLFTGEEQKEWRIQALESICGSETQVRQIFALFQCDRNIGLYYPETVESMPMFAHSWLQNKENGKRLAEEFGFEFEDVLFNYPVGSFFWAKTDAIKPLLERRFTYEDFPQERGQTDGTLAHALERAIAFVAKSRGYECAIGDIKENVVRFHSSDKPYRQYLDSDLTTLKKRLKRFDIVSFDIFDTLITRKLFRPDDLFVLMGDIIKIRYAIETDYLSIRKEAERQAWKHYGARTNIYLIYKELEKCADLPQEIIKEWCKLEIELEYELCVPRKDMLELYNWLKQRKAEIYLVSDMYLPTEIVAKILRKCGYDGYDRLYISCDVGLRKDDMTMWHFLKSKWGERQAIHIGDNLCSDIQLSGDLHFNNFMVLSPFYLYALSPLYANLKEHTKYDSFSCYVLGKLFNENLFNSPFALNRDYKLRTSNYESIAQAMFGPLLLAFIQALSGKVKKNQLILFLSREGYLLQQLYKTYVKITGISENPSCYFLTSRRAVSVAAIKNEDDVKCIFNDYYLGSLGNLLDTRLGVEIPKELKKIKVEMPDQSNNVMQILRPQMQQILKMSTEQRQCYQRYADEQMIMADGRNRPIVVDIGFSGTIQYYLSLMLDRKIDGFYLYTKAIKKPVAIGCECDSLLSDEDNDCGDAFVHNSLYLESVLQAPYGQLKYFKKNEDGKVIPIYGKKDDIPDAIFIMQRAIIDYIEEYAELMELLGITYETDGEMAAHIFIALSESHMIPQTILSAFSVEDYFSGCGTKKVDEISGEWIKQQNI